MIVKSREHGRKRSFLYGCSSYHLRGKAICPNRLEVSLAAADAMIFDMIEHDVLDPYVIDGAVSYALTRLEAMRDGSSRRCELAIHLQTLESELGRLTAALAAGANFDALLAAIGERERKRTRLRREIDVLDETTRAVQVDRKEIEVQLRKRLDEWRGLLRQETLWSQEPLDNPSSHALEEMEKDSLTTVDVVNVLRGGIVEFSEEVNRTWRYRLRTARMTVVVAFRSEHALRIVTAWRKTK